MKVGRQWQPISKVFFSASTETNAFFYALTNLTGTQEEQSSQRTDRQHCVAIFFHFSNCQTAPDQRLS
jgi:hypothetical protein